MLIMDPMVVSVVMATFQLPRVSSKTVIALTMVSMVVMTTQGCYDNFGTASF